MTTSTQSIPTLPTGIYATKLHFQRVLAPIAGYCARRHMHPDVFTYGAIGCSALAGLLLAGIVGVTPIMGLTALCLILRLGFNLMDGLVARATGLADTLGELKNEFGDRISDVLTLSGLLFGGLVDTRLAGLTLALVLGVSYLGILSKALGGARLYGGIFGKGDRMLSLAATCVLAGVAPLYAGRIFEGYLMLACTLALVTIVQRLRIIVRTAR